MNYFVSPVRAIFNYSFIVTENTGGMGGWNLIIIYPVFLSCFYHFTSIVSSIEYTILRAAESRVLSTKKQVVYSVKKMDTKPVPKLTFSNAL